MLTIAAIIAVHPAREAQIATVNGASGVRWVAAPHSRFASDAPGAASARLMGVKGNWTAHVELALRHGTIKRFRPTANVGAPVAWDAATAFPQCAKIIGDIRDQSNCGCCWAFGGKTLSRVGPVVLCELMFSRVCAAPAARQVSRRRPIACASRPTLRS